jgi:hypothetical protein
MYSSVLEGKALDNNINNESHNAHDDLIGLKYKPIEKQQIRGKSTIISPVHNYTMAICQHHIREIGPIFHGSVILFSFIYSFKTRHFCCFLVFFEPLFSQ